MALTLSGTITRTIRFRAPVDDDASRTLFRDRLQGYLALLVTLAVGYLLLSELVVVVLAPTRALGYLLSPSSGVQLGLGLLGSGAWFVLRQGRGSPAFLDATDVLVTVGFCVGWVVLCASEAGGAMGDRSDLIAQLAIAYTLVTRAALVPSSPARTAAVSATGSLAVLPLCVSMGSSFVREGSDPLAPLVYALLWCVVSTLAVTSISRTIYGLRREVSRALRLGQYVLEEEIGRGGMGVVYRARHALLRRPTAVKLLARDGGTQLQRFEREVQLTARLAHPNTIAIYDFGHTPERSFYYAMELVDGLTLERIVEERGPLSQARVVHVLEQLCGALGEAHAAGLVHRDIKPANLMLVGRPGLRDVLKVLDFGLVKEIESAAPSLSMASAVLGTPHFMAPEAILRPESVDARADLYAVGATAAFLLTGRHVFDGANLVEVCSKHLHEAPAPLVTRDPTIAPELDALVLACLAKDPAARPPSAKDLARRLGALPIAAWTEEDADAWWSDRGAAPGGDRTATPESVRGLSQTLRISIDERLQT